MTSKKNNFSGIQDVLSEDENLIELKRKGSISVECDDKRVKCEINSDNEPSHTQALDSVEVEQVHEAPIDYTNKNTAVPKQKQSRKSSQPKKVRSYPCPDCDTVFYNSADLKNHSLEHLEVQTRESTKAATTMVQTITSRRRKKTNAQRCREYREKKKLQNTMVQNITAERLDECSGTDQLPVKKPKTDAERRKKYYEAQKLKKQKIKKIPKTAKQRNKECYYRKNKFLALNTLNHHSDAHKCEECGRLFMKASSLKMHQKVHTKDEKCPLCHLAFNSKRNLARHMMSHDKSEQCDQCPSMFHTKEQLAVHVKTHEDGTVNNIVTESSTLKTYNNDTNATMFVDSNDPSKSEEFNNINIKVEIDLDSDDSSDEKEMDMTQFYNYGDGFQKRDDLTHSTLCAIVSKMHKGRPVADICRLFNLRPEVVNEIWEDREKYLITKKGVKTSVKYMNSVLDTRIIEWFHSQKAKDIQVSGKMVQDIAEVFAKENGFLAFNGSKKWLDRFKKKYNISFRAMVPKRDYNVRIESKWRKYFFKEQWCDVRVGVADEDIYTGDEVGLYYNPSKGRIKKLTGKKFIQGYAKDRFSIFICTNVNGTDKKKLLVCGTEDPLIHSHRDPTTLPVTYIRHSQAHFTTAMFEEYVRYWNRELQAENRKAILILDRATIHTKLQLSNLKLVFVPWKASTGLVPIKNGIYNRFRAEFRKLILEEKAMNVLRGVDRNLTCLEALTLLEKAWDRTPADVIIRGFLSAGYDVQSEPIVMQNKLKVDNDVDLICKLLQDYDVESYFTDLGNLDMFLTVDEEQLTGQGTNCSVFGGNHKVIDPLSRDNEDILPISTEQPDTDEKEALIMEARAMQDLEIVRKYLLTNDTPYEMYRALNEVEKFVTEGNSD